MKPRGAERPGNFTPSLEQDDSANREKIEAGARKIYELYKAGENTEAREVVLSFPREVRPLVRAEFDRIRADAAKIEKTAVRQPAPSEASNNIVSGHPEKNMARRTFLALGGTALAGTGLVALGRGIVSRESSETSNAASVSGDELDSTTGETEKASSLKEAFTIYDNRRFENGEGQKLNDPDTVGGHAKAWDAGEREGNERTRHWVAYKDDLLENQEFLDLLGGKFEGLKTADDYGDFFNHITLTTRPVAAAELSALRHPEFANLSLEDAEEKLRNSSEDEIEEYSNWLDKRHEETQFKFVDIPDGEFKNLGIADKDAEHGMFTICEDEQILRDEYGHLVEATTTTPDGSKVTRFINPVCMNVLNEIKIDGKTFIVSENEPPTLKDPGNPDKPNDPDKPKDPEDPEPKDYENMERIDSNAHQDIANNVGTEEVRVSETPSVESQPVTQEPSSSSYEGTSPQIVESAPSQAAEPVTYSSPENNYSQDLGAANTGYAPVQPDTSAPLAEASNPPASAQEATDILGDLGIN